MGVGVKYLMHVHIHLHISINNQHKDNISRFSQNIDQRVHKSFLNYTSFTVLLCLTLLCFPKHANFYYKNMSCHLSSLVCMQNPVLVQLTKKKKRK